MQRELSWPLTQYSSKGPYPYLFKINLNIILLYMPTPAKWFLPSGLSHQNLKCVFLVSHFCHVLIL